MGVLELPDVETGLADFVLTQLFQQSALLLQYAVQVENQVLFAGREANREPVSLGRPATVVKTTKADDCFSSHDGRLPGKLRHQLQYRQAIGALLLVRDAGRKLIDTGVVFCVFSSVIGDCLVESTTTLCHPAVKTSTGP